MDIPYEQEIVKATKGLTTRVGADYVNELFEKMLNELRAHCEAYGVLL